MDFERRVSCEIPCTFSFMGSHMRNVQEIYLLGKKLYFDYPSCPILLAIELFNVLGKSYEERAGYVSEWESLCQTLPILHTFKS